MDYNRIYNQIIENSKNRVLSGYTEKHHIIPRSMGGDDGNNNLAMLTAREHFICHYLLTKMVKRETNEWYKMNHAFMMMKCSSTNQHRYFNSRLYEALKSNFADVMSFIQTGKSNSQYGTRWIHNLDIKKCRKIPKNEELPDGWIEGRKIKWNGCKGDEKKLCKRCGQPICPRPEICKKYQTLRTLVKCFGMDEKSYGSLMIYDEYDRIKNILITQYHVDDMSIEDLRKKYNFKSNERMRKFFHFMGIERRSVRESLKVYNKS